MHYYDAHYNAFPHLRLSKIFNRAWSIKASREREKNHHFLFPSEKQQRRSSRRAFKIVGKSRGAGSKIEKNVAKVVDVETSAGWSRLFSSWALSSLCQFSPFFLPRLLLEPARDSPSDS